MELLYIENTYIMLYNFYKYYLYFCNIALQVASRI